MERDAALPSREASSMLQNQLFSKHQHHSPIAEPQAQNKGSEKVINQKPSPILEMHGIDMGQFFGQTMVRTPHSIKGTSSNSGSSQKKLRDHQKQVAGGNLMMMQKNQIIKKDVALKTRYQEEDGTKLGLNFKEEGKNATQEQTPLIFETSRFQTTHGVRSTTSFNPSMDQTRNYLNLGIINGQAPYYFSTHSRSKFTKGSLKQEHSAFKHVLDCQNYKLTLPLENLAVKKSVNRAGQFTTSINNGFRPESAIKQNRRLMLNYGIMMKNRQEYNNYKIMESIQQKQQNDYQVNRANRKQNFEESSKKQASPSIKQVANQSMVSHYDYHNPQKQVTHILLSDLLFKNQSNLSFRNNQLQPQSSDRDPRIKQLSRGGAGFSLSQHKLAKKSRNAKLKMLSHVNTASDVMKPVNQTFTMKIPEAPILEDQNNRYFDGFFGNDTMVLEFNKEQIDLENAYADYPPIIPNKQDENFETSIEVGQGQIDTTKSEEEASKDMAFNVTVMGRHKVSSKEYKNGMKSQKNQSMSDISVIGQSDEVSQNPMFNQQRLNTQGENRSPQESCPYFNKPQSINRPQTAFNLNQQIQRNLNSNSTASTRLSPGRPKSRSSLLKKQNSQGRNILSNNIIDLNIQLGKEHPPLIQQPFDKLQTNQQQRLQPVVPVKGSRPKTAAEFNSNLTNIYQNLLNTDVNALKRQMKTPLSSCNNRDQRSQLSKSFRALSKKGGVPHKQSSLMRKQQPPIQQNLISTDPYHRTERNDCPQFFAKQLKLEENSPQKKKQMLSKQYQTTISQINKLRQYHLNSYLNQVVDTSESNQQETTLEVNNEGKLYDAAVQKGAAGCEARGFMQVVIPIVQNNGGEIIGDDTRGNIYGSNNISNRRTSSHGRGSHQHNSNRRQSKIDLHNTIDSKDSIQIQI